MPCTEAIRAARSPAIAAVSAVVPQVALGQSDPVDHVRGAAAIEGRRS